MLFGPLHSRTPDKDSIAMNRFLTARLATRIRNDDGTVSVDWIVLSASAIALAATSVHLVSTSAENAAGTIKAEVANAPQQ
ncbi:hypothetical protein [Roseovarius salinarum]|uniref:hypothetical protein n=1 Tax=Roseovarius salinarum TaxID=1981892 RepID=UPI0012FFD452|nr:hypothetical protein [Roseovarius salinarum]